MPFFSVIIPTFNRKEKLRRAITSVLGQEEKDFELIVVDDGSDDGTPELADEFHGRIKYIFQKNSGVSTARNSGIKSANSPYITLLDSDDTWNNKKLRAHKEFINSNPHILIHQTEDIWIRNGIRVNPGTRHLKKSGNIFIPSLGMCVISPSSVCLSETLFEKYGYFDEELPACEDYDLWLRITLFEYTGLIKEKLITRYAGHDDQLSSLYWGMDRFRLYSILKLLYLYGDVMDSESFKAASQCARSKADILINGARKRGNSPLVEKTGEIISLLEDGKYRQICYQILLKI